MDFRCVLHGSFSQHFEEIQQVRRLFERAGIEVLAPKDQALSGEIDGFAFFADEAGQDPRLVELLYLHNLRRLGERGFSYFVNPEGDLGKSASYELGIAQLTSTRCFFMEPLRDHPAYVHKNSVISPENLAAYIHEHQALPAPAVSRNDQAIDKLWRRLMVPGSVVATGAIIEYQPGRGGYGEREILLVKTHKWGNRYSMVGEKLLRGERLHQALLRGVHEETRLKGEVGAHICTFDQIKNSGYYQRGVSHIFVDNIVKVKSRKVVLNDEAQEYIWARPSEALRELDIEPNARTTVELYQKLA